MHRARHIIHHPPVVRRRRLALFLLGLAWAVAAAAFPSVVAAAQAKGAPPLVLAVHPYLPPPEIKKRFAPLAAYLSARLHRQVVVRVSSDYTEHISGVGADRADLAFIGPAPYVHMVQRYGRKPILARLEDNGRPELLGNIVVRKESAIRSLRELKGTRFAFVSRESTMGYLIPRQMLLAEKITLADLAGYDFLGSHQNVALAVRVGDFEAGAVQHDVFLAMQESLRSLAQTPPVSEHLFVASTRLAPHLVAQARAALLAIGTEKGGLAILQAIKGELTNLVTARDEDYDPLRGLLGVPRPGQPR